MCKHIAAVLYGVGNRLDDSPELLFRLPAVDPAELISTELVLPDAAAGAADTLAEDQLGHILRYRPRRGRSIAPCSSQDVGG